MRNPWTDLSQQPPYALASDIALLNSFNARAPAKYRFDLSLFPEPFHGAVNAPVVILNLNPGWSPGDAAVHADPAFATMLRKSLEHRLHPHPFLHLQPGSTTPGARWWQKRTLELADDAGFERAAQQLACIQFNPYHSPAFARSTPRLPSQDYSFNLVRLAMLRGAEIVIMRSVKLWLAAVPELESYGRVHRGSNPRVAYISRGNLKTSYDTIVARVRSAAEHVGQPDAPGT